jgi:CheY-like chemotaxis protein
MAVVLVVNEDRDMLDMYGAVLEEMGHRPVLKARIQPRPETVIANGAEALLLDLEAETDPVAGLRVIEALRADPATQEVPIILCTAAPEDVRPLSKRLDDLDVPVLVKPFHIETLRDVIGQVLPPAQ